MSRMQQRRDTSSNWANVNPTLASGEIGVETNTLRFKVGDGSRAWSALPYAVTTGYSLSATTTNTTPTRLTGDSLALEVGEAWQFEVKLVARNKKTDATKVWSIRGGIRRGFAGAMQMAGSLDTLATGSLNGASVEVAPDYPGHALAITVTGPATASVDWQATVLTSEKVSTQQALVGGCTDVDVDNYNASADFDDGSCSYSPVPSSPGLVPVVAEAEIESLSVSVGANSLYPSFDPSIKDYYVQASAAWAGSVSYSITINNGTPITGSSVAGKTLQINDGTSYYYVRMLPSDVYPGTPGGPAGEGYVPGYYLTTYFFNGPTSPYFYVFDQHGVPAWYVKTDKSKVCLHPGNAANRVLQNVASGSRSLLRINSESVTKTTKNMLPSANYGTATWGSHETREVGLPLSRKGNIISQAYADGFYIQEQTPDGVIAWEWHSEDYFTSTDAEYYHINSVDIHPTSGNVLVSLRNCSAVLCIEYQTKNVLWVLQGPPSPDYGTLQSVAIPSQTANTKWLTLSGEPEVSGFQYVGPRAQHDARWRVNIAPDAAGNEVISLFDNQSEGAYGFTSAGAGPSARGVVYEIDYENGVAIHRSSVFSENGTCMYMGSYTIVEEGGEWSHALNFPTQHPALVEWIGPVDGEKTKVLEVDYSGDLYRIIKVPPSFLRADNLRATCGMNVETGAFPSSGGGGGGGGGGVQASLLLHFDGSNGSTTFTDSSANALTVTASGDAAISTAQSQFGGASGYFDGDGDFLSVPYSESLNLASGDWTAEVWWRPSSDNSDQNVFSVTADGTTTYAQVRVTAHIDQSPHYFRLLCSTWGDWVDTAGGGEWSVDNWYHIAAVRAGDQFKLFVNGVEVLTQSYSGSLSTAQGPTIVGAVHEEGVACTHGYIDELRIVKGTAVYTSNFTPPTAPFSSGGGSGGGSTALLLHFDGSNGSTTFTDSGANALTVTGYGNAQISTAESKSGGASLRLASQGDYLTFSGGASIGTGDFCVEFWLNSSCVGAQMLFDFRTHAAISLWMDNADLWLFNSGVFGARATITANTWTHFAVTRQGSTLRLFVDGVNEYETEDPSDFATASGTNWIGKAYDADWSEPNYYMDEFRIVVGDAVYTDDFTPPSAPFTA